MNDAMKKARATAEVRARILALDRGTLLDELLQAERTLNRACGAGATVCEDLLREYHLIEGALEIRAGTAEEDLLGHVLETTGT